MSLEMPTTPHGPSLTYTTTDSSALHQIDGDAWDPAHLSPRERAVCIALLEHALTRLQHAGENPRLVFLGEEFS